MLTTTVSFRALKVGSRAQNGIPRLEFQHFVLMFFQGFSDMMAMEMLKFYKDSN